MFAAPILSFTRRPPRTPTAAHVTPSNMKLRHEFLKVLQTNAKILKTTIKQKRSNQPSTPSG